MASIKEKMRSHEAAEYLGISRNTLYNEVSRGNIKRKKFGRRNIYLKEDLDLVIKDMDNEYEKIFDRKTI